MDQVYVKPHPKKSSRRSEWRYGENYLLVILYILFLILQCKCQITVKDGSHNKEITTKRNIDNSLETNNCHSCHNRNNTHENNEEDIEIEFDNILDNVLDQILFGKELSLANNKTNVQILHDVEDFTDKLVKTVQNFSVDNFEERIDHEGRAIFAKYTYGYRMLKKVRDFLESELSINLPDPASVFGFRSFGLKKFFLPFLIGAQIFKSILLAMFLPSILGSFGKILGKGISTLSATSSQASYPPAGDDQLSYNTDANKDFMGYETNQAGVYVDPQEYGDANDLSNVDMSRFGAGGGKVSYLPSKNGYYKNQMASASNNYKVFQKIPASSMILSNYDPFYSPLLSRLDGIFARLGLAPSENAIDSAPQVGGQSLSDVKLESCREQLICLMYSSPAKYAPYSNLVSAQLSRELNELRRPVSDNPEILRFFRYMRAARRGQEGVDCMRAHPACTMKTSPQHTMIAAYHDINKLVTARKVNK